MKFDNLKDKCEYYKSLNDTRLTPNSYVLAHIDGRGFSKLIKKKFERPFDTDFIRMMNVTAKYICSQVQGCKIAYVQSDEISLVITDFDTPNSDSYFGYRNCKLHSIIASLATGAFNKQYLMNFVNPSDGSALDFIDNWTPFQFDTKCWNVHSWNDAFAWLLYRQIDCVRNSKQQAAQTYLSHKELVGKDTDEQIKLLKEKTGIDWYTAYDDGMKYGRFIYKQFNTYESKLYGEFERNEWTIHNAFPLMEEDGRERFETEEFIPKKEL